MSFVFQAKYEDIKAAVKAASQGPMKGILGYTDEEVYFWLIPLRMELQTSAGF